MAVGFLSVSLFGCSATAEKNVLAEFRIPQKEADWIVEGKPIEYQGELWYPQDAVDILLDSEVKLVGEYKGVQFFVEKTDVRPYNRLYTKFGQNKFRIFEKRINDDQGHPSF